MVVQRYGRLQRRGLMDELFQPALLRWWRAPQTLPSPAIHQEDGLAVLQLPPCLHIRDVALRKQDCACTAR